jgi:hypothetical protein
MRRDMIMGRSFLVGTPPEIHFGLGEAATVDRLEVTWTDGSTSVLLDVAADRHIRIAQGQQLWLRDCVRSSFRRPGGSARADVCPSMVTVEVLGGDGRDIDSPAQAPRGRTGR